jgi:hypothetical protein
MWNNDMESMNFLCLLLFLVEIFGKYQRMYTHCHIRAFIAKYWLYYESDNRGSWVRYPGETIDISPAFCIHTGSWGPSNILYSDYHGKKSDHWLPNSINVQHMWSCTANHTDIHGLVFEEREGGGIYRHCTFKILTLYKQVRRNGDILTLYSFWLQIT